MSASTRHFARHYVEMLVVEHLVMLPSMLVAMLLRRDEYTRAVHDHSRQRAAA